MFIINDLLPIIIKSILNVKEFKDENTLEICENILFETIDLINDLIFEDNLKIGELFATIFDPCRNFYKEIK